MMILDGFNTVDQISYFDFLLLRKTVTSEIELLQQVEKEYRESQEINALLVSEIGRKNLVWEQAKVNAAAALQAEERARKALEDAMNLVASTKMDVNNAVTKLNAFSVDKRENDGEIERLDGGMHKQQEKVRHALRRKEQVLQQQSSVPGVAGTDTGTGEGNDITTIIGDFDIDKAAKAQEEVEKLLKEKEYLRAESGRLEDKAERLESRALKLLERADELEEEEEEAYKALEEVILAAKKASDGGEL